MQPTQTYNPAGFYFCENDEEALLQYFGERPKMLHDGGKWSSMRGPIPTIEEAREKWGVPDFQCAECGRTICSNYNEPTKTEMLTHRLCFRCNFWRERWEQKADPHVARIGGNHYWANPFKKGDSRWNGFGGRISTVRWNDGREVTTNDLWYQGDIPLHWRVRLPDNAEFVKRE